MKPENHYLLYFEFKNPDYQSLNSESVHCDDLQTLVHQVRECINKGHSNIIIKTIVNAKPKLT